MVITALLGAWSYFAEQEVIQTQPDYISTSATIQSEQITNNQRIPNYYQSRKLAHRLYAMLEINQTFYCGCRFIGREVDLSSCDYRIHKNPVRASHMEWEHIVPVSVFGRRLTAWREGHAKCHNSKGESYHGRRCARKVSKKFNRMEADLHNILPSVGEINADRENYQLGMILGESRHYGSCDLEIKNHTIEPRPDIRGDIARIYLYMDRAYPGYQIIDQHNRALIAEWHKADPVSDLERQRNRLIGIIQGNYNPFIEDLAQEFSSTRKS